MLFRDWQRLALLALTTALPLARPACAQTKFPADPIKFGQIDPQDLTAAPFAADSAAAAVVLCDYGRSQLKGHGAGLQVVFERITRIKILRKAGFDEATVEIPLYHREENSEKVSSLRGCTYNLVNGKVEKTKLETSGVFLEKRTPTLNVQKFTLPNVREGAVVEFAYTLTSDYLFNFQDWTFQRSIPVRWSEYRASIPAFYKYTIIYQTPRPFDVQEAYVGSTTLLVDRQVGDGGGLSAGMTNGMLNISAATEEHRWVLQHLPGLSPEPYMTTLADYAARLDFELAGEQWPDEPYRDLTGSWEKINARLLAADDFGDRLAHAGFLRDQLPPLVARYPDPAARAAAVRALVMSAVRYDGTNRYFAPEPLRKAYDAHLGSAADVNLLLIAALRDAALDAHPLLLSTRSHGLVHKEFPLLEYFNYVAAVVVLPDGHDLLLDATDPQLPSGVLPERCLNRVGRLVGATPATSRWLDLTPAQRSVRYQQVSLALDARGGFRGRVHCEQGGYAAAAERHELAELGEKKYLAGLARRHEALTLSSPTLAHADDPAQPLALDYELSQPGEAAPGSPLYLSPLREFGLAANPFRHENRTFAVDFGMAQDETLLVTLALPEGYAPAALPAPLTVELPEGGGRFVCTATAPAPGTVVLSSRLSLNRPVYSAAQYPHLRELYRRALEKQAEQLVIQKKAGS